MVRKICCTESLHVRFLKEEKFVQAENALQPIESSLQPGN